MFNSARYPGWITRSGDFFGDPFTSSSDPAITWVISVVYKRGIIYPGDTIDFWFLLFFT